MRAKYRAVAAMTAGVLVFLVFPAMATAQEVKIAGDQQYVVLEVAKLDTFEKELNSVAGQGFRLMMSTTRDDGQRVQAFMQRTPESSGTFQYRLVATFSTKTGDKEMNAAAAEGFRVVPHTSMLKKGLTIFNTNNVVVMEKASSSVDTLEYMTITAIRTDTFHRELKLSVDQGWKVVDMTYGQVLLERVKAK
jgi:hypothetical protein